MFFAEILFVTGGRNSQTYATSELIDLNGRNITCSPPADLPAPNQGMSSLKTDDGNPLACGGFDNDMGCWEYIRREDRWQQGPNLMYERTFSPAVKVANDMFYILSASDYSSNGIFNSEVYSNDFFSLGPPVPADVDNRHPCAAAISETLIFFANDAAYILDTVTNRIEETPTPMLFQTYMSHCGVATKSDGSKMVVVAGSFNIGDRRSTQILDLETGVWRMPNTFPFDVRLGTVVPYGNTFLILGGRSGGATSPDYATTSIIEFEPDSETWVVRQEHMTEQRSGHYAAFVDREHFDCQSSK